MTQPPVPRGLGECNRHPLIPAHVETIPPSELRPITAFVAVTEAGDKVISQPAPSRSHLTLNIHPLGPGVVWLGFHEGVTETQIITQLSIP